MKRLVLAAFAGAAAMVCAMAAPAAPVAPVKMVKLERSTAAYDLSIEYPQMGMSAIDNDIAAWAKEQGDGLVRASHEHRGGNPPYSLEITSEVVRNDSEMFEVVFNISADQNWAHPSFEYETLNYLRPDGARFLLAEALAPGGFKRISGLAISEINQRLAHEDGGPPDPTMLSMGAAPYAENFRAFAFTKSELVLYFGSGQIDAYAVGPQESHIPLAKLTSVLRADWRAPLPSFDCAKAVSAIEKNICDERALARLDRQVAEIYGRSLRDAAFIKPSPVPGLKAAQRGFIAKRTKDCDGLPAAQMHACLMTAYRARLLTLKHAEENP